MNEHEYNFFYIEGHIAEYQMKYSAFTVAKRYTRLCLISLSFVHLFFSYSFYPVLCHSYHRHIERGFLFLFILLEN